MESKSAEVYRYIYTSPQWNKVKKLLEELSDGKFSKIRFTQILYQFHRLSDTRIKSQISIKSLLKHEINKIFALVAKYILKYQNQSKKWEHIIMLRKQFKGQITFKKQQVILLMCLMSCCLTVRQSFENQLIHNDFNTFINFGQIYSIDSKTQAIITYLKLMLLNQNTQLNQQLTLIRGNYHFSQQDYLTKTIPFSSIQIKNDKTDIQQCVGSIKIDFANKYIGGGALSGGAVQEQIMFVNHPQMNISTLFCQKMKENQAIGFIGFKKYFKTDGYGRFSLKFDGYQISYYKYDQFNRAKQYIVAIDALVRPGKSQFFYNEIFRELKKCQNGFKLIDIDTVATGNWGCGAFGGDVQLKFIIQWIAASFLKKKMIYLCWQNKNLINAKDIVSKIQKSELTINEILKIVLKNEDKEQVFKAIAQQIKLLKLSKM